MKRVTPLGALLRGVAAGLAGAVAQDIFFAVTKRLAPAPAKDIFAPPEIEQEGEMPTQTVARRFVEGLAVRGPIQHEALSGHVVHHAFGTAWGGVYGIMAASVPRLDTLRGGLGFGVAVWLSSDNLLLPLFRLSAWPQDYPVKTHAYALVAHFAYGAAVYAVFRALERVSPVVIAAVGAAVLTRKLPKPLRRPARRFARKSIRFALPAREIVQLLH
jgi:uncharacterized membrane protein YagU involved in acid resistance